MPDDPRAPLPMRPDEFALWLGGAIAMCGLVPTASQWREITERHALTCPRAVARPLETSFPPIAGVVP